MIIASPISMSLAPTRATKLSDLRVASILDQMSHESFAPECRLVTFAPHNWLEVLENEPPNLLLVESAWRGNSGSWEYKVGTYSYTDSVGLPDLSAVVEWCRSKGIPTVFWNKEDPIHFEKFKEAAALFDVVFTTDAGMVDRYRKLPGRADRVVGVLPFAAQPMIHNPVGAMRARDPRPVFAGAYYRNRHESRREELDMLLDAAVPYDLVIYDRMGGAVTDSFGFPDRFQPRIEGTLTYKEMVDVYRTHRLFLNVNSVSDSPTMFSRRVFELLASGTPVVSTASIGVEQMFPGIVDIVHTASDATESIARLAENDRVWLDRSVRGIEAVLSGNTYGDRLHTIASAAGLNIGAIDPSVSVVIGPHADVTPEALADTDGVTEVLSFTNHDMGSIDEDGSSIRQVDAQAIADAPEAGSVALNAVISDWIAFVTSSSNIEQLRSLTLATRIAPADVFVPASSWAEGHVYVDRTVDTGCWLVSAEFVARTKWSPWGSTDASALGARIYAVPIVND